MRIHIEGDSSVAAEVRSYLRQAGYSLGDYLPKYTIYLEEHDASVILFDSVDCPLERNIQRHIRELTETVIQMDTAGGMVHGDDGVRIVVPSSDQDRHAVGLGIFRGIVDTMEPVSASSTPAPSGEIRPALDFVQELRSELTAIRDSIGEIPAPQSPEPGSDVPLWICTLILLALFWIAVHGGVK